MNKKKVAVIGATGIAGQQFLAALPNHPQFEIVALAASKRSAGKQYLDAIRAKTAWSAGGATSLCTPTMPP